MGLINEDIVVDILNYDGVGRRTVSGWKHSSTKAQPAGIVILKERQYVQRFCLCLSIGSDTVFFILFICMPNCKLF